MRRVTSVCAVTACAAARRGVCGVAPVLYFAPPRDAAPSREEQVRRNTNIALEMVRRYKAGGAPPTPYKRTSSATIEQLEREVEVLLGGTSTLRSRSAHRDDAPMDKLSLIERCLRHAVQQYRKDEGVYDFAQMQRWLVYTAEDELRLAQLRRQHEQRTRLAAYRQKRAEQGGEGATIAAAAAPTPRVDWASEYAAVADREVVQEKRLRYDALAAQTTERDEAQIDALQRQYRQAAQDKRLDELAQLLEKFKPVLAREAIMQRLTIKHLEGQLGIWRYLDWCPEVRDRAEMEADVLGWHWWSPSEERRLLPVRLRSVSEVREIMTKAQAEHAAAVAEREPRRAGGGGGAGGSSDADRERLLKEVLALQARIHQRDESEAQGQQQQQKARSAH